MSHTAPEDQPTGPAAGTTSNELSGTVSGHVIQARSIAGDVHFHAPTAWGSVPRQLPARVPSYVNRSAELAALDRHAAEARPGIAVVAGGPGSGKTALALHWAHQIRTQFPDGDLFVNIRGYDAGSPPSTDAVLDGFLRALNVPPGHIPADTDAKAALYRSLLAERRVLLVLDNAGDAEQVRALLPGSDGCATVITSRSRLAGLTAREGAARMDLSVLPGPEALELLRAMAGAERIDEAPTAAELASLCGRLPLALRIAGDYLASHPFEAVIDLVDDLAVEGQRLESLGGAEQVESVRAVFSWSYRALPGEWARAFRLLGLHVGHDSLLRGIRRSSSIPGSPPVSRPSVWPPARAEARTRLGAGRALLSAGRAQEAIDELEAAQRGFEETGTPVDTARVALVLSEAYAEISDLSAARKTLFQATWLLGPAEQNLAEQLDHALTALSDRPAADCR